MKAMPPAGVAMIVQVTTDNKNRAASEVRSVFTRYGGNLAGAGAVLYKFQHIGQFLISKDKATEDTLVEIALDAGADDVITTEHGFEIRCAIKVFDARHPRPRKEEHQARLRRDRLRGHADPSHHQPRRRPFAAETAGGARGTGRRAERLLRTRRWTTR